MLPALPISAGAGRRYQGTLVLVPVNGKDNEAPVPASGLDPDGARRGAPRPACTIRRPHRRTGVVFARLPNADGHPPGQCTGTFASRGRLWLLPVACHRHVRPKGEGRPRVGAGSADGPAGFRPDGPRPFRTTFDRTDRDSTLAPDVSRAAGVSDLARRSATGLGEHGAVSAHWARITRLMRAFRRRAARLL